MTSDIYTDGAMSVGFAGGMLRIDFGALSLTNKTSDGKTHMETQHRLVMTPQGFFANLRKYGKGDKIAGRGEGHRGYREQGSRRGSGQGYHDRLR